MIIDPIADMFTRIRNSISQKLESVIMPYSKIKYSICDKCGHLNGVYEDSKKFVNWLLKKENKNMLINLNH